MIEHLLAGHILSPPQTRELVTTLTDPDAPDARKAALLVALRAKGERPEELRGMAMALRDAAVSVDLPNVLDTAGTGGDGMHSVNLSTAAALVVAAAGVRVAKHGNRSVSSRCGSADVLEALGMQLPESAAAAEDQLETTGFTFLFAPWFHPAMRGVAGVRRAMGVRTAFNLLGPLCNPARPERQLLGAYSEDAARTLAEAAVGLVPRATVVHSLSGHDEATPISPYVAFEVRGDLIERHVVDPASAFGIPRCNASDLRGGDPHENAQRLTTALSGRCGPVRDAIELNAALCLTLVDHPSPLVAARDAIGSGAVVRLLEALRG